MVTTRWSLTILLTVTGLARSDDAVDYLRDVKPILQAKCYACHGALRQRGALRLDTADLIKKGGDSGPAIVVGKSTESLLIEYVSSEGGAPYMPPEGEAEHLSAEQIALLSRWIDQGAVAPAEQPEPDPRQHWAYQAPDRPEVPTVANAGWVLNPIDAFIAAEHERLGLTPAAEADRATLLRRLYVDLIGVPPTREELHAFLTDMSPTAYEEAVDRLLADARYGERWGRHWLDIWRYSDWYGSRNINELRNSRRHIWRWRDWTIESINEDKGYDRMLQEMLAADELAPGDRNMQRASGYLGRSYYLFNRYVWLQDTVEYLGTSILGMTLKCCRCHDHKYDPISQEEYYQLRAVFEPLQVRTDEIPGRPQLIQENVPKMAAIGAKLHDGYDCIYDGDLSAVTYLLERGNEKSPVTDVAIAPGIPDVFGLGDLEPKPVDLPVIAYYPELEPAMREQRLASAADKVRQMQGKRDEALAATERARKSLADFDAGTEVASAKTVLDESFEQESDRWRPLSGNWIYKDGALHVTEPGHFLTITTVDHHPQDFRARIRYKTTEKGSIHSVGVAFDVVEAKDWQAVYTYPGVNSAVQAFHRQNGRETYPARGVVRHPIVIGEEITLELAVRGLLLNVWVNGELKIAYTLPMARQPGSFALWTHTGTAEFYDVRIDSLPPATQLVADAAAGAPSPFTPSTRGQYQQAVERANTAQQVAEAELKLAQAEEHALQARIDAEVAKHSDPPDPKLKERTHTANAAQHAVNEAKAYLAWQQAEQKVQTVENSEKADQTELAKLTAAAKEAETKYQSLKETKPAENVGYEPIGAVYPETSSGRRLALAKALTDRKNPLTARVAVNHIWLRHFGSPLVPTVFNFGLNGKPPTHPKLLDWLAVEFMENGWKMKHLHRLMVTSRAYRLASTLTDSSSSNQAIDNENTFLWRANSRRMEAEVVRDGILHLAGELDLAMGGPDIDPEQADAVARRSIYFRHTPDQKPVLLEMFDAANPAECYQRDVSIIPQQALALANSAFSWTQARRIAGKLSSDGHGEKSDSDFVTAAFEHLLSRVPSTAERSRCEQFLTEQAKAYSNPAKLTPTQTGVAAAVAPSADPAQRARENLVHVLLNYNEFVTVR